MIANEEEWVRIAKEQYKQGEIYGTVLDAIQIQKDQHRLQQEMLVTDRSILIKQLNVLLQAPVAVKPSPGEKNMKRPSLLEVQQQLALHPLVIASSAKIQEQKALTGMEKNSLSPDLNLGYSNLSIIGWQTPDGVNQTFYSSSRRFGIYQLGLSIPLFNGTAKARVEASKLLEKSVEFDHQMQTHQLSTKAIALADKMAQLEKSIAYYEMEGLEKASKMSSQSSLRLKKGDIPFSEWAFMVSQTLQIRLSHAEMLHQMELALAESFYLNEKNSK
jgi:cobalt-zinc-cadmium resistance protein CzcA